MNTTPDLFAPTRADVLAQLDAWVEAGVLRHLDAEFARFLLELDPRLPASLLLASALLSHLEGRGHSCLVPAALRADAQDFLAWPSDAAEALKALQSALPDDFASALIGDGADGTPLVLEAGRLYLRRYWQHETRIAAQISARLATHQQAPDCRAELDALFAKKEGTDWQKIACANALPQSFAIITGGPGTGKTYTVARLIALLFASAPAPENLRIALAAPTGKAAARLKQSIDKALAEINLPGLDLKTLCDRMDKAKTLHALLGARPDTRHFRHHAGRPLEVDVLIVDEASMIHLEMMSALLDALPPSARLILLGDKDQLASVEAGAVLGDLCRDAEAGQYSAQTVARIKATTGETIADRYSGHGKALAQATVMLRESRRFGGAIGQLALAVNAGDAVRAQEILNSGEEGLVWHKHARQNAVIDLAVEAYRAYLQRIAAGPQSSHEAWAMAVLQDFDAFRLLCALREGDWGVSGLNSAIEARLAAEKLIRKNGEWYAGRPVMVTRNDGNLGVFNGDIGLVLPAEDGSLRAYFLDGSELRSVLASRLADAETAYAMTVHKSQGSEFAHTVLVLPEEASQVITRELVYTGITRARERFSLFTPRNSVLEAAIKQKTRRASGLAARLAG